MTNVPRSVHRPNPGEILIAPSILSADFGQLAAQIAEAEAGGADWIHIDVMDGHFVPNLTIGVPVVEACRRATNLPLDVHLMIEKPERLIHAFATAGADSITVHVETCPHLHRTIQQIRSAGCRTGVAVNPATPAWMVEPVLGQVDLVLVMSVNPGFSGQDFIADTLKKTRALRDMIALREFETLIEMDGGISEHTISACRKAGAQVFIAGSAIFKHPAGIHAGIRALRDAPGV